MSTDELDTDAIRARAEAATYLGGEAQEVADDALALLAELAEVQMESSDLLEVVIAEARAYHHETECFYLADVRQLRDALVLANATTHKAIDERDALAIEAERLREGLAHIVDRYGNAPGIETCATMYDLRRLARVTP